MVPLLVSGLILAGVAHAQPFDLAPFARPCCRTDTHTAGTTFDYDHPSGLVARADGGWVYGLQWAEERDIAEVRVRFRSAYNGSNGAVQYWFSSWPCPPPKEHTIEDPVDDPWQGRWIEPKAIVTSNGMESRFAFPALAEEENPRARNLPGVTYRRAIKLRLVFPAGAKPEVAAVQVFGATRTRAFEFLVRFQALGGTPEFEAWNGRITEVRAAPDATRVKVEGATGGLPGSHDITVVKVRRGGRAFSFAVQDLDGGPLYVPDFGASLKRADDATQFSNVAVRRGLRIRERLAAEPEQSYERATREIPPLDPVIRSGGRLLLPLAAEASWQKFGVEWGGHVRLIGKPRGRELERLTRPGSNIGWRIGTGDRQPGFRDRAEDSTLAVLEDYLPVSIARWSEGCLKYEEEAFATLLEGPLSPEDGARSERTPAVLMMKLRVQNTAAAARTAHVWLAMNPGEPLEWDGEWLTASAGKEVRARLKPGSGIAARVASCEDGGHTVPALHLSAAVAGKQESVLYFSIPFVPGLSATERGQLGKLDYAGQRERVVRYWREATARAMPFQVPEPRFMSFSRGLLARIKISATKDPKSGLYMVPAASHRYQVFANEAAFQCQLLDVAGHADLAARYLRTPVVLQGSRPLVGSYTGDQKPVYYGARVDAEYDYTDAPYGLHHGTVLWTLAEHYFLTRDRAWLASVKPGMKRAADWIVEQRRLTRRLLPRGERCPEYGLLPAGRLEDNRDWGHWFSVNAYASAGLSGLAEALTETGDTEAARYADEARRYREELRAAVARAYEDAPVVRLRDHTCAPYVPTRAHQRIRLFGPARAAYHSRYGTKEPPTFRLSAIREVLYGPMILLETGVFGSGEPLAGWVLDDWEDNATMSEPLGLNVHGWVDEEYWFSRGGMVFQPNLQNPIRTYLRRGEIAAAVRGLYNNFVSCYYPSVNCLTEEYRRWRYPSGPFFKVPDEAKFVHRLRDLLVTESEGDLDLARGTPRRWLEPGREISVTAAPTRYGPVSYTLRASADEVRGSVALPSRSPYRYAWISVRLPEDTGISSVAIDGREWQEFNRTTGRIRLPESRKPFELIVKRLRR